MKGELNGVSPVFARVSGFVASVARPRRSQVLAKELVAPGDGGHNRAAGGRWSGEAVPMTIETGRRSKTVKMLSCSSLNNGAQQCRQPLFGLVTDHQFRAGTRKMQQRLQSAVSPWARPVVARDPDPV